MNLLTFVFILLLDCNLALQTQLEVGLLTLNKALEDSFESDSTQSTQAPEVLKALEILSNYTSGVSPANCSKTSPHIFVESHTFEGALSKIQNLSNYMHTNYESVDSKTLLHTLRCILFRYPRSAKSWIIASVIVKNIKGTHQQRDQTVDAIEFIRAAITSEPSIIGMLLDTPLLYQLANETKHQHSKKFRYSRKLLHDIHIKLLVSCF